MLSTWHVATLMECILIFAHCFIPKNNGSLQTDLPPGPPPKRYSIPDHIKPEVKPSRIEVGVAYMSAWRSNLLHILFYYPLPQPPQPNPLTPPPGSTSFLPWIYFLPLLDLLPSSPGSIFFLPWIYFLPPLDLLPSSPGSTSFLSWIYFLPLLDLLPSSPGSTSFLPWIYFLPPLDLLPSSPGSTSFLPWIYFLPLLDLHQLLCWGVRDMKRFCLMAVNSPCVELECGGASVRSNCISDASVNPNFPGPRPFITLDQVKKICQPTPARLIHTGIWQ